MFRKFLALLIVVFASSALADSGAVLDLQNRAYFVAKDGFNMTIGTTGAGETFTIIAESTPVASLNGTGITLQAGQQIRAPAAAVITPETSVPTPSAGNTLTNRNTIVAAGAPTAAFVVLPAATASVGRKYTVFNQGSNPVAIVPQTGVINVSAALTPFACTTLKECECTGLTTGVYGCSQK